MTKTNFRLTLVHQGTSSQRISLDLVSRRSGFCQRGMLLAENRSFISLVRRLGTKGVIRIGGSSSDRPSLRGSFSPCISRFGHTNSSFRIDRMLRRLAPHGATSFVVSLATSALTLLVTGPAVYSIIWLKPCARKLLQSFMLTSQMLPAIVFVIPLFVMFSRANLVNTLPGLILADMTLTVPFALVMLCAYVREFPYELVEAALVEAASQWRAFRSVVVPVMTPGLVTIGIFSFLMPWGDLIYSLSLITEERTSTSPRAWAKANLPVRRVAECDGESPRFQASIFLGLPWQYTWGSGRFSGVAQDVRFLAEARYGGSAQKAGRVLDELALGS